MFINSQKSDALIDMKSVWKWNSMWSLNTKRHEIELTRVKFKSQILWEKKNIQVQKTVKSDFLAEWVRVFFVIDKASRWEFWQSLVKLYELIQWLYNVAHLLLRCDVWNDWEMFLARYFLNKLLVKKHPKGQFEMFKLVFFYRNIKLIKHWLTFLFLIFVNLFFDQFSLKKCFLFFRAPSNFLLSIRTEIQIDLRCAWTSQCMPKNFLSYIWNS